MGRGQSILIPTSFPPVPCSPDPPSLTPPTQRDRGFLRRWYARPSWSHPPATGSHGRTTGAIGTLSTPSSPHSDPRPLPIRPIQTRDRSPFAIRRLPPHPASTLHVFECALLWSDIGHCQVAGSGPMHFSTPRARRELASAPAVRFPALVLHTSATRVTTGDD